MQHTRITAMTPAHAAAVLAVYQAGIDTGDATFETAAPTWERFDATRLPAHRLVALAPGSGSGPGSAPADLLGWAAVSRVSERPAYAGVVEHSVYVAPAAHGRGIGTALLAALIADTEAAGIWTLQSGIFPENTASLRLHAAAGFRTVGVRERIGRLHGRWRDVVLLERRSDVTGK
jgi:phosphinothricin acetyltransferase